MRLRSLVLVILVVVAALGIGLLALRETSRGPVVGPVPNAGAAAREVAALDVDDRGGSSRAVAGVALAATADALPEAAIIETGEIEFDRTAVYGRVVERGKRTPVAGAEVRLFARDPTSSSEPLARVTTDAAGRFHIGDLAELEEYWVDVDAAGLVRDRLRVVTGRYEEVALRRGVSLSGHVLRASDRSPVEDVWVWAKGRGSLNRTEAGLDRARTGGDGSFLLGGLPAEAQVPLLVQAPGRLVEELYVLLGAESAAGYEVLLSEARTLTVQLVDLRTGLPLAGLAGHFAERGMAVDVDAGAFEADRSGSVEIHWAATAQPFSRGPFEADEPTRLALEFSADGYCLTRAALDLTRAETPLVVPMTRGVRIEGRVTDDVGGPMEGVTVSLERRKYRLLSTSDATVAGFPPGISIVEPPERRATTDAEGHFAIGQVVPRSEYAGLGAIREGWFQARVPVTLPGPDTTVWVDIAMERSAAVRGRILLDGEPFVGAVEASRDSAKVRSRTNAAGEYLVRDLAPGEVALAVLREDPGDIFVGDPVLHRETVHVRSGETLRHDIDLAGDDRGATVSGVVLTSDREPLEDVVVYVVDQESTRTTFGPNGLIVDGGVSTRSGAGGHFLLEVEGNESIVEIVALHEGIAVRREVAPGASGVELVLPATGTLELTVVDPSTGEAPDRLRQIHWWRGGSSRRELSTGARMGLAARSDGRFALVLAAGVWDLEVDVASWARADLRGVVVETGAEPTRATIELERGTTLVLDFYFDQGVEPQPMSVTLMEVDVMARALAGDTMAWLLAQIDRVVRADASGRGRIEHLAPGTYELATPSDGWSVEPAQIDIPDAASHTVEIRCFRAD